MANTLKFGAGEWAYKAGSVLAYNDENNNFKPLPFTFTRASSATRVNSDGLIESVASGVPRIDYLNNAEGHLLLEPSRTNTTTYSDEINNAAWIKSRLNVSANQTTSPDGSLSADRIYENSENNYHSTENYSATVAAGTNTASVFAKADSESRYLILTINVGIISSSNYISAVFDLFNGTIGGTVGSGLQTYLSSSIQSYGNGWYRCSVTGVTTDTSYLLLALSSTTAAPSGASYGRRSYQGDGTSGLYVWGGQMEAGSYATSYIPTSGSTVTRVAEVATQTPPSGIIGQTEGTFFLDFSSLSDNIVNEQVSLSDGTDANTIKFVLGSVITGVQAEGRVSSVSQFSIKKTTSDYDSSKKISVAYKANDFVFYYNGEQVGVDTSGTIPALSQIKFSTGAGTNPLYGKIKNLQIYNTRLSNAELASLTS